MIRTKTQPTTQAQRNGFNQFLNTQPACRIKTEVEYDAYFDQHDFDNPYPHRVSYRASEISFWLPDSQRWHTPDNADQFIVHAESLELARSEFWSRLTRYCVRRFGRPIFIEKLN